MVSGKRPPYTPVTHEEVGENRKRLDLDYTIAGCSGSER